MKNDYKPWKGQSVTRNSHMKYLSPAQVVPFKRFSLDHQSQICWYLGKVFSQGTLM
jgi:hypothetical protein